MREKIYDHIGSFHNSVLMPGGWSFNHVETLADIERYYNSKFKTGDRDSRGFKKFFYNINKPACDIATKFVDLDTKDIILKHQLPDQEWKVWIMMHDLKEWLKANKFGKLLNELAQDYPKYGHIFVKKVSDKWHKVNLHNLRFDPASPSLQSDVWLCEVHEMSSWDIYERNWNEKAVEELLSSGKNKYIIYEYYEYDKGWRRKFCGGVGRYDENGQVKESLESLFMNRTKDFLPSIVLFEDEPAELPYRELKWEDVPGRRLGMGSVEYLFDNQVAENEAENLERKGLYYTSLHIFQTRDSTVGRNILTDAENGDILRADDEIRPVAMEERNLPAFNSTRNRWAINTVQKTFTTEVSRGENLPSRTPLGVANLQASMVASYFELKRENFGMFVRELIEDAITNFKTDRKDAHQVILRAGASGLEKFIRAVARAQVDKAAIDYALGKGRGFFPSTEERKKEEDRLILQLSERKAVPLALPDRFYEDAKYGLEIITTGEQVDVSQAIQTMQVVMQLIASNPAILQNKGTRTILFKSLELAGLSPVDLNLMEESVSETPEMPQGGSIGIPSQAQPRQGRIPQAV